MRVDSWEKFGIFYATEDKGGGGKEEEEKKEEETPVVEGEEKKVEEKEEEEEEETTLEEDATELEKQDKETQKTIEKDKKEAKEDIADLLGLSNDEKKAKEEEDKVEDKGDEKEVKEEKKEEGEEKKEEKVEGKEEEKKEDEDPLLTELGRLTDQIAGIEKVPEKPEAKAKEGEEKPKEKPEQVKAEEDVIQPLTTPVDLEDKQYVTTEMFKESFDETDRKQLNTIINAVVKHTRETTRQQTLQDAMKIFPGMMDYKMQGYMAAQEFWTRNTDLKTFCDKHSKVKTYVQYRSTEIQRLNPNFTLQEVFNATEKEVKELLKGRLKSEAPADSGNEKGTTPGLVRKPGAGRKTPAAKPKKPNSEQAQILELMDFDK